MLNEQNNNKTIDAVRTNKTSAQIDSKTEHISICVCTYLRPKMLADLIEATLIQKTENLFTFSIIIVDNDPEKSGYKTVKGFLQNENLLPDDVELKYEHMPTKGISYARNKSIEVSTGDFVAFIDDDEIPEPDWLLNLYKTINKYNADGVFGSVLPKFQASPPDWVVKHKFFFWRDVRFETGADVANAVATNNALFRRCHITNYNLKFGDAFAFIGGEDQEFFFSLHKYKRNVKYVSCHKAIVHETLIPTRCTADYIKKRLLLEGTGRVFTYRTNYGSKFALKSKLAYTLTRSILNWIAFYVLFLALYPVNKDTSTKYYYKTFYHVGVITAIFNRSVYSNRKSIGLL